jgi:hypothetical protein
MAVAAALLYAALALAGTLPFGVADNGDFRRFNAHLVTGVQGRAEARPAEQDEWRRRWRALSWDRYWDLRPANGRAAREVGSVDLLWRPGVWLGRHLGDGAVLDLRWLGAAPRAALLAIVLGFAALCAASARQTGARAILPLALGWAALWTATRYTIYLHSFFRETATLVFVALAVLAAGLRGRIGERAWRIWFALAAAAAALSAPAHAPLAWIAGAVLLAAAAAPAPGAPGARRGARDAVALLLALAIAGGAGAWSLAATPEGIVPVNVHNSIFTGLAPGAPDPARYLARLGFPPGAERLVGRFAHDPEAAALRAGRRDLYTVATWRRALTVEPGTTLRAILAESRHLNDTSVVGHRFQSLDDEVARRPWLWNAWGELQVRLFPRGAWLWLALAALAVWSARELASGRRERGGPALVVLYSTLACAAEIVVNVLGDGAAGRVRHLVAADLLLSSALLGAAWLALVVRAGRSGARAGESRPAGRGGLNAA